MKYKKILIGVSALSSALCLSALITGCNKSDKNTVENDTPVVLETLEQKASYIIAYDTAQRLDAEGINIDADVMRRAVQDFLAGKESVLSDEEMQATMMELQAQIEKRREEQYRELAEENKQASEAFLAENGAREGVVTTGSGLQYEILQAGEGKQPSATDEVTVNYKGSLLSGEVFDQGSGVSFVVNQLIPGWVEALPLMKEGAKWKIYIPSDLAYGPGGTGSIGPNAMIIFEMELVKVGPMEETAANQDGE